MPVASRVATAAKHRREYGIITQEILDDIFTQRLIAADLISRSDIARQHHAGQMVLLTLDTVKKELERLLA